MQVGPCKGVMCKCKQGKECRSGKKLEITVLFRAEEMEKKMDTSVSGVGLGCKWGITGFRV